ncbi:MAG: TdeIII family type II restriction endonuclease [Limisphaerales bacterium]
MSVSTDSPRPHLDMKHQVVLQDEFWDIIGGKGTFASLLEIYAEVGKEKGRQIIDRLGYDF